MSRQYLTATQAQKDGVHVSAFLRHTYDGAPVAVFLWGGDCPEVCFGAEVFVTRAVGRRCKRVFCDAGATVALHQADLLTAPELVAEIMQADRDARRVR